MWCGVLCPHAGDPTQPAEFTRLSLLWSNRTLVLSKLSDQQDMRELDGLVTFGRFDPVRILERAGLVWRDDSRVRRGHLYPSLSTDKGSTFDARRAGPRQVTSPVAATTATANANAGSW